MGPECCFQQIFLRMVGKWTEMDLLDQLLNQLIEDFDLSRSFPEMIRENNLFRN